MPRRAVAPRLRRRSSSWRDASERGRPRAPHRRASRRRPAARSCRRARAAAPRARAELVVGELTEDLPRHVGEQEMPSPRHRPHPRMAPRCSTSRPSRIGAGLDWATSIAVRTAAGGRTARARHAEREPAKRIIRGGGARWRLIECGADRRRAAGAFPHPPPAACVPRASSRSVSSAFSRLGAEQHRLRRLARRLGATPHVTCSLGPSTATVTPRLRHRAPCPPMLRRRSQKSIRPLTPSEYYECGRAESRGAQAPGRTDPRRCCRCTRSC